MDGLATQAGMVAAQGTSPRENYLAEQVAQGVDYRWFFEISSGIRVVDDIGGNDLTLEPNIGGSWTGGTLGAESLWAGSTSADFDGSSSGRAVSDFSISFNSFSGYYVECLFYHTSGQAGTLMSNGAGDLLATTASNALSFNLGGGATSRGTISSGWNLVALNVRGNNAYRMYINGSLVAAGSALTNLSTSQIHIGSNNLGSGSFYSGRILSASVYVSIGSFGGSLNLFNAAFS